MLRGEGNMSLPLLLPIEHCSVEGENDTLSSSTTNEGEGEGNALLL